MLECKPGAETGLHNTYLFHKKPTLPTVHDGCHTARSLAGEQINHRNGGARLTMMVWFGVWCCLKRSLEQLTVVVAVPAAWRSAETVGDTRLGRQVDGDG